MKIIKSKIFLYIVIFLIFGIWILFFDDYKWSKQKNLNFQLKELQKELEKTETMIKEYELKNKIIENDMEILEAIGRTHYYMKHDDEDLYIFLKEDENGKLTLFK